MEVSSKPIRKSMGNASNTIAMQFQVARDILVPRTLRRAHSR
jgi:hypothetical protein